MYIPSLSWFTVAQLQCVYLPFTLLVIPGAQILDFFYSLLFLVGMWIHVSEQENKTKQIGMGLVHCVARNQAFFLFFFKHVFKNPGCSSRIIKEWNQGKEIPVSKILMSRSGGVGGMQVSMSYSWLKQVEFSLWTAICL